MEFVTDLHLHSKYSRAVSSQMMLFEMAEMAKKKGIDILSASDFTHPLWFKEIQRLLEEKTEGLYTLKGTPASEEKKEPLFLLSVEIASIYKQGEKLRRIHNLVFAPNLTVAAQINAELKRRGCNLSSDGRPIIGLSSKELLELILEIDERCLLIPAHIWTPHFGIYGSASGFDSLEQAFGNLCGYIYGIETGLSSDPEMNWQVEELQNRSILSFSDAHSLPKMGRELTVFTTKDPENTKLQISYEAIRLAIMRKSNTLRIGYSLEFYPEEGKYHFSGHRNCKVSIDPIQVKADGNTCPVCKRRMTEGVLYRVQQLSSESLLQRATIKMSTAGLKWYTDRMKKFPPYIKLVPLNEIIAESVHATPFAQKVKDTFALLCEQFGSEVTVLLKTPLEDIKKITDQRIADGIQRVRGGDIVIAPGYDGEYGKVSIWPEKEEREQTKDEDTQTDVEQMSLV
jgi:uncharacterized protein (TIGR00375 family)